MRTEVNIFFALLFVCSFIVSVAFANDKNESGFSNVYKVNGESLTISGISSNKESMETYETVAPPTSDTSSMHGKNGEYEVYHEYVNIKTINLKQKYPPLPTRFFYSNERTLFYKINEQMSYDFINKIGYFSTYLALEKHYLDRNSSR
ncbi:MAG: hypothetical protein ACI33M_06640 [Lysinibacillus sp.]